MDKESVMERVTTAGAGVALTSPYWLHVPDGATTLQILGGLWLAVQIIAKIYVTFFKKDTRP